MTFRRFALVALVALVPGPAHADGEGAPSLAQLFPRRAELAVTQVGLQALSVPVEILRACRPGLADLRLLADGDIEVPYLLDATGPDAWKLVEKIDVKPGRVRHDDEAPLCEPARWHGPAHCESIEFSGPPRGEGWELVFAPSADRFVERVQLAIRRGDHLEKLGREESIYRLPNDAGERLRLPLPAQAVGAQLTVVMEGDGAALSPRLQLERGSTVRGGDTLADELPVAAEWRDQDGTHLVVERPSGFLPTALEIGTTTAAFDRAVQVYDLGRGEARTLVGEGKISRLSLPAAGGTVAIDAAQVPLGLPRGRRLELVIHDGDSPRLDALKVRAVLPRPVLLFSRSDTSTLLLYVGGGRVEAPRYDLQSLLPASPEEATGVRAQIAARLRENRDLEHPTLGPLVPNPRFDRTPLLAAVTHAGPVIEVARWTGARPFTLIASADGLSRYRLHADDLAATRPDLRDLRVADAQDRQWPYLVDHDADPEVIVVDRPAAHTASGVTRYTIPLPAAPLTVERLELDIAERFFDRAVTVVGEDENGHQRSHEAGRIDRQLREERGAPVRVEVNAPRLRTLTLEVADGGDAPLTIERVRLIVPTAEVALAAPPGSYRLLVGYPDAEAPSYELSSLEGLIGELDGAAVEAQPLAANPRYSTSARLTSGAGHDQLLVWIALGIAVLVLGFYVGRFALGEILASPQPVEPKQPPGDDQEPRS